MKYILQVCLLMLTVLFLSFENKIHFSSVSNAQARIDVPESVNNKIRQQSNSIRVLIIPCSNGYGYSGAGYDFNPVIERELNKNSYLKVLDFPYKKLVGVTYQGVYDKKYAKPIINRVEADIFIMTRFIENAYEVPEDSVTKWGYEIKILNVKTMKQKVSIGKSNLASYPEIEKHIVENRDKLIRDILALK